VWPDRILDRISEIVREGEFQPALAVVFGVRSYLDGRLCRPVNRPSPIHCLSTTGKPWRRDLKAGHVAGQSDVDIAIGLGILRERY
jgi:hypothetical protein